MSSWIDLCISPPAPATAAPAHRLPARPAPAPRPGGARLPPGAPALARLRELPPFFGALGLTAFHDNAAITYLASLVPGLNAAAQYAVVAGAVTGGGLTVIANAPNPAGQAVLADYFPDGFSPGGLLLGALLPTAVAAAAYLLLP